MTLKDVKMKPKQCYLIKNKMFWPKGFPKKDLIRPTIKLVQIMKGIQNIMN